MALNRINADSIADGTVVASDIADGTITAAKFATLSANVVSTANFNAANFIATNDVFAGTQDGPQLGGATNPIIAAIGNTNNYIQNYIINYSNTANASADYVAYPNNGSDANGWIDIGITSNTFNQAAYNITGRNEGYLFMSAPTGSNTSGNLVLGTDSTGTNNAIEFYTGGFGQGKTLPRMRIANNGVTIANLIIGTGNTAVSLGAGNATRFKNRIINGAMVIDQRNVGASVTQSTSATYVVDRFFIYGSVASKFTAQQNGGSVTLPAGYINYLGITSSSAYTVGASDEFWLAQRIEGLNIADLAWGTANAKTVTLSFQIYSSLTGTFGGVLKNSAGNRSYPFTYTVSSASTWTSISITIAGDTTGTWLTTNGIGISVIFGLGVGSTGSGTAGAWAAANYNSATGATSVVGTSGATFYITGVQLEVGSSATGFDYRDITTETIMCQRYYTKSYQLATALGTATVLGMVGGAVGLSNLGGTTTIPFPVQMRSAPTMSFWDSAGTASVMTATSNGSTMINNNTTSPNGPFNITQNNFWITANGIATYVMFLHYSATAEL